MKPEPLLYGIKQEIWDKLLAILHSLPQVQDIVLFGSRAKGNFKPGSDIDLCIKGSDISPPDLNRLLREMDDLDLPWEIDLLHYESLSDPAVKEHIDRMGISL